MHYRILNVKIGQNCRILSHFVNETYFCTQNYTHRGSQAGLVDEPPFFSQFECLKYSNVLKNYSGWFLFEFSKPFFFKFLNCENFRKSCRLILAGNDQTFPLSFKNSKRNISISILGENIGTKFNKSLNYYQQSYREL